MKAFLTSAWNRLARNGERRAVEATRRQLIELDDRTLADIGISRALLGLGSGAWPWRLEDHGADAPALDVTYARAPHVAPSEAGDDLQVLDRAA